MIGATLKGAARAAERGDESEGPDDFFDPAPTLALIERYHGVADSIRRAEVHAASAAAAIAPFPDCQAKRDLLVAAEFSVTRDR